MISWREAEGGLLGFVLRDAMANELGSVLVWYNAVLHIYYNIF